MYLPITSACTYLLTVCFLFFFIQKLCLLHEEYLLQSQLIEKDVWLRQQCSNPETYAKINHHPGLCEKIEATARVGAFWFALNKVVTSLPFEEVIHSLQRSSWQFFAIIALICLFFPSLCITHLRYRQDRLPLYYQNYDKNI